MSRTKTTEIYGPMPAVWEIRWEGSGGVSMYNTAERAASELAYFVREGRSQHTATITRIEYCPAPGCNGDGTRAVRRRGSRFFTETPCVGCRGRHEYVETWDGPTLLNSEDTLANVLSWFGLVAEPYQRDYLVAQCYRIVFASTGWEVTRGSEAACWAYLVETGRIIAPPPEPEDDDLGEPYDDDLEADRSPDSFDPPDRSTF